MSPTSGKATQHARRSRPADLNPDFDANLELADRLTRAAAADGAQLVVLPEKWTALGRRRGARRRCSAIDGPAVAWARAIARELGIDLVAGSFSERRQRSRPGIGTRLRNTSVHVGPDGELHAAYRKVHMFDVVVDGTAYRESEHEEPGDELVVSTTADGIELGLSICYDIRFPELYRILAVRGARDLHGARRVHRADDARSLGGSAARPRDRGSGVRRRRQPDRRARAGLRSGGRSMIVDPVGDRAGPRARSRSAMSSPTSISTRRRGSGASCRPRQSPARAPTAGRRRRTCDGCRRSATPRLTSGG